MTKVEKSAPEIYVQPGESLLVKKVAILRTLLGSCVGVTFLVPRLGVGALCHPMLPSYSSRPLANPSRAAGRRYVDFAIRDLARQLDALGARRDETQVKLFGGADVLPINNIKQPTVGKLNSEAALRTLDEEGFQIAASSLGGSVGLQILFHTGTGEVLLRRLS